MTARFRAALHVAALSMILFGTTANGRAQTTEAELLPVVYAAAASRGASAAQMIRIIGCESRWNPHSVGAAGELGLVQLHPRGLLLDFYRVGYADPFDPSEAIDYLAYALSRGMAGHWSCAR